MAKSIGARCLSVVWRRSVSQRVRYWRFHCNGWVGNTDYTCSTVTAYMIRHGWCTPPTALTPHWTLPWILSTHKDLVKATIQRHLLILRMNSHGHDPRPEVFLRYRSSSFLSTPNARSLRHEFVHRSGYLKVHVQCKFESLSPYQEYTVELQVRFWIWDSNDC